MNIQELISLYSKLCVSSYCDACSVQRFPKEKNFTIIHQSIYQSI